MGNKVSVPGRRKTEKFTSKANSFATNFTAGSTFLTVECNRSCKAKTDDDSDSCPKSSSQQLKECRKNCIQKCKKCIRCLDECSCKPDPEKVLKEKLKKKKECMDMKLDEFNAKGKICDAIGDMRIKQMKDEMKMKKKILKFEYNNRKKEAQIRRKQEKQSQKDSKNQVKRIAKLEENRKMQKLKLDREEAVIKAKTPIDMPKKCDCPCLPDCKCKTKIKISCNLCGIESCGCNDMSTTAQMQVVPLESPLSIANQQV